MASNDDDLRTLSNLLARMTGPARPTWSAPGDLSRMSGEALASRAGDVRETQSSGHIHLTGAGVRGHSAGLDDVSKLSSAWQRLISAMGASLQGVRSNRGPLSGSVVSRTRLNLNAAPGMGSVVLSVAPAAAPMDEVAPGGRRQLFDEPRPLADEAVEAVLALLATAEDTSVDADPLAHQITEFGPRVASALRQFSEVASSAHFDVGLDWAEPARPTVHARLSASTSGWLADFVRGRDLDAEEATIVGEVRTVSDVSKWLLEVPDQPPISVDASALDSEVVRATRVGQMVRLLVTVRTTLRPDGTKSHSYKAQDVLTPEDVGDDQ